MTGISEYDRRFAQPKKAEPKFQFKVQHIPKPEYVPINQEYEDSRPIPKRMNPDYRRCSVCRNYRHKDTFPTQRKRCHKCIDPKSPTKRRSLIKQRSKLHINDKPANEVSLIKCPRCEKFKSIIDFNELNCLSCHNEILNSIPLALKKCIKCQVSKPFDDFFTNHKVCKKCRNDSIKTPIPILSLNDIDNWLAKIPKKDPKEPFHSKLDTSLQEFKLSGLAHFVDELTRDRMVNSDTVNKIKKFRKFDEYKPGELEVDTLFSSISKKVDETDDFAFELVTTLSNLIYFPLQEKLNNNLNIYLTDTKPRKTSRIGFVLCCHRDLKYAPPRQASRVPSNYLNCESRINVSYNLETHDLSLLWRHHDHPMPWREIPDAEHKNHNDN